MRTSLRCSALLVVQGTEVSHDEAFEPAVSHLASDG